MPIPWAEANDSTLQRHVAMRASRVREIFLNFRGSPTTEPMGPSPQMGPEDDWRVPVGRTGTRRDTLSLASSARSGGPAWCADRVTERGGIALQASKPSREQGGLLSRFDNKSLDSQ